MRALWYSVVSDPNTGQPQPFNPSEAKLICEVNTNNPAECLYVANTKLRQYLLDNNIYHFLPYKRPSYDANLNSIMYYHNQSMYNIIYKDYPQFINMPIPSIEQNLNDLYNLYNLENFYDPRSNAKIQPE